MRPIRKLAAFTGFMLLFPAIAVHAAEAAKEGKPAKEGEKKEGEKKDAGPSDVDMPPLLAPMGSGHRLESYAYISIQLTPSTQDKILVIREKVPFIQDAFLREVNKTPVADGTDPKKVDQEALKKRLLARLNQILPKDTVSGIKFEQITMAPLVTQ